MVTSNTQQRADMAKQRNNNPHKKDNKNTHTITVDASQNLGALMCYQRRRISMFHASIGIVEVQFHTAWKDRSEQQVFSERYRWIELLQDGWMEWKGMERNGKEWNGWMDEGMFII